MADEWDEAKRRSVLATRDIDFAQLDAAFRGRGAIRLDDVVVDGERRSRVVCLYGDRLILVVFTMRDGNRRFITARPLKRKERRLYDQCVNRS